MSSTGPDVVFICLTDYIYNQMLETYWLKTQREPS